MINDCTNNSVESTNNISKSGLRKDRFVFTRRRNGTAMSMPIENPYADDTNRNPLDIDVAESVSSDVTINSFADDDHSNANVINVEDSSDSIVEQTISFSNMETDQLQTSVVNTTKECNTQISEADDKIDTFLVPRRFKIKPGKSWRRSMAFLKRSTMAVDLSSNISNENVLGSFSLRKQLLDVSVCRQSVIKFIPKTTRTSDSAESFQNDGYVPNNKTTNASVVHPPLANSKPFTEETALDQLLQLSVRHSKRFSLHPRLEFISARDLVLRRCEQTQPIPFAECFPDSLLKNCHKIGEGVYGEVFLYRNNKAGTSVMKVIPIQGDQIVNGERQKKFEEIISEIVIAQELSDLRNSKKNSTSCFNEVYKIHCVKGKYPVKLLDLWDLYEESRGSDNDCPDIFGEDQLYIILELANGGQDLESFVFKNAQHAFSVFKQIAFSLAVAESSLQFEHRDLHWGNVLISNTRHPKGTIFFNLNGRQVAVRSYNIQASIIDFTLSRITNDDICIFNDLSQDPDLFNAEGDYQFEIYRLMQKCNGNDWQQYKPYTNVLWMHYILDKMIHMVRYKSPTDKVHQENIERMQDLKDELFEFKSAEEFVIKNLM
ncbi:PREDICTED: putative serine/threonine-protein kinase haspin homolog [Nicrophorus vespilloides]|uniref:non-specific serine/threonine protein kinase n=1 Tax=Nicrophorus vespilloides TaxID=110193 RepID=A0ABM1NIM8_NICVS|nr:PREDICTED: putative serine/threonine-protein kinase haspin homolog [Nicrophorus vespilloides]